MNYLYDVYEYFPGKDIDEKRLVWTFDEERSAVRLREFIESNDYTFAVLGIEKRKVKFE